jgi:histidine triad (HIT) family protein
MDCPFCKLVEGNEQNRVIRKQKLTTTFLSNPRLVEGHTLVIPNRHVEKPWELTYEELITIFDEIKWVQGKLLDAGIAQGVDTRQHYRPFISQGRIKIDHVHFHVLPRNPYDEIYQRAMKHEVEMFAELSANEADKVTDIFKD